MRDPERKRWADKWLQFLPTITPMKQSAEKYVEQRISREQFLRDCDQALLKNLEEQEG